MTRSDIDNLPNYAGIYLIKNKINGKCYIGQAIKLKKRLREYWNNYISENLTQTALYRALRKYGPENFELTVLDTFRDALNWRVPSMLDELEKKYIQEYDSCNHGYNSTIGDDAGVLELKHAGLAQIPDNWIKCKNLETGEETAFQNTYDITEKLGIPRIVVHNCLHKKQKVAYKKWQIAHYNESFDELPEYGSDDYNDIVKSQFKVLSNKENICEYIKENPYCTYGEISQTFNLSRQTFYNYKQELGIINSPKNTTNITKEEFVEYFKDHTKHECISHFNITDSRYYKYIHKYIEEPR